MKIDFRIATIIAFSVTALAPAAIAAETTDTAKIKAAAATSQEAKVEWVYEGCATYPVTAQKKRQNMSVASTGKMEASANSSKTAE